MVGVVESLMYEISGVFLLPVLVLILALFVYSLYALGVFFAQMFLRNKNKKNMKKGYDIVNFAAKTSNYTQDELEIYAYKRLENSSIITRVAPMLGLVATMIPMGPALKALSSGNVQGISDNLIIAFSAVIFSLISASITYWITSVRKRWFASEISLLLKEKS